VASATAASATRSAVGGLLAAAAFVALFGLLYLIAVGTDTGLSLDRNGVIALDETRAPRVFRATQSLLETISVVSVALFGAAVAALAALRRRPMLALAAVALIAAANVTTQLLKPLLGALDPTGGDSLRVVGGAFPSGHSTVAASLAAALVLASPRGLRPVAAAGGALYAAAVGVTLVLLGWHYPSDVAGAYLVVGAWASLMVAALAARPASRRSPPVRPAVRRAAAGLLLVVFAAMAVIGGAIALARAPELLTAVRARTTFFAAAAGLAVLITAILGLLALVLDRDVARG
jgi:membrane-associated phospholipid phosphatase